MSTTPDPLPQITQAVRDELARTESTLTALAESSGVQRHRLSEWLGGKRWASPATMAAVLEALNLELIVRRRRRPRE